MNKKIYNIRIAILCWTDSEDMDVIIPFDIWKRAGIIVETISNEKNKSIFLQSGTKISCTNLILDVNLSQYNAFYLPGGKGAKRLLESKDNEKAITNISKFAMNEEKKWIFASSQSVLLLKDLNLLGDKKVTCYPGDEEYVGKNFVDKNVVYDKNFVTVRAPFYTFEFALFVVEKLLNKQIATNVANDILFSKH